MKATELMIGDWVQNPLGAKGWVKNIRLFPKESDGLGGYYVIDIAYSKDGESYARLEEKDIKPIPLTEEILKANGWRAGNNKAWLLLRLGCDEVNIMLGKNYAEIEYLNMCYNPEDPAEVNYGANFEFPRKVCVHELQHILRMYDVEKDLKLEP